MFYRYVGLRRKAIDLDNSFKGSCFLVGGGYQLKQETEKLSDHRIKTMAMNNAATQFDPTLWVGADTADHYSPSILMNSNIMKFTYITRKDGMVINKRCREMDNMYFVTGLHCEGKETFLRGRNFGWWKNVFMLSIQLLHRLGFKRVYTVGCGFKIDSGKGAYGYKSDLSAEEMHYNTRTYKMVLDQMKSCLEHAEEAGFEIISCTPDSTLNELVPYKDFDEAYQEEITGFPEHTTVSLKHPKRNGVLFTPPTKKRTEKVSILIPTYQRDELLELGLSSIEKQKLKNVEILVLNDGPDSNKTKKITEKAGAKYVHTGVRFKGKKKSKIEWRVPGFAFNIGAKMAKGDIFILTCPEMWHMEEDTIEKLVEPVRVNPKYLGITFGRDDSGSFLNAVKSTMSEELQESLYFSQKELRTELPFLMALRKEEFISIGGYDEDFTGRCYDDDDFIERLKGNGCQMAMAGVRCMHLFHERATSKSTKEAIEYNKKLFLERKGQVLRNQEREWGVLK